MTGVGRDGKTRTIHLVWVFHLWTGSLQGRSLTQSGCPRHYPQNKNFMWATQRWRVVKRKKENSGRRQKWHPFPSSPLFVKIRLSKSKSTDTEQDISSGNKYSGLGVPRRVRYLISIDSFPVPSTRFVVRLVNGNTLNSLFKRFTFLIFFRRETYLLPTVHVRTGRLVTEKRFQFPREKGLVSSGYGPLWWTVRITSKSGKNEETGNTSRAYRVGMCLWDSDY